MPGWSPQPLSAGKWVTWRGESRDFADEIALQRRCDCVDQSVDIHRLDRLDAHHITHDAHTDHLRGTQRGAKRDLIGTERLEQWVEDWADEQPLRDFDRFGQPRRGDRAGSERGTAGGIPSGDQHLQRSSTGLAYPSP